MSAFEKWWYDHEGEMTSESPRPSERAAWNACLAAVEAKMPDPDETGIAGRSGEFVGGWRNYGHEMSERIASLREDPHADK